MQATGKPRTRFMHCLPSFPNLDTEVGRQIHERYGLTEAEVTDEVFESDASVVFTQAENRMHTIKAVLVATWHDLAASARAMKLLVALGGNALLHRGQALSADNQLANIRVAAAQLARVASGNDLVVTHGNGSADRFAGTPVGRLRRRRCLSARHARRRDRRHDRLPARAGTDEPTAGVSRRGHLADPRRGRPARPGVREAEQTDRADVQRTGGQTPGRAAALGSVTKSRQPLLLRVEVRLPKPNIGSIRKATCAFLEFRRPRCSQTERSKALLPNNGPNLVLTRLR